MKNFLISLFVFAMCIGIGASADKFTMKVGGFYVNRGGNAKLIFHVPFREENRSVEYRWDGENLDGGSSEIDLVEGDHVTQQVTFLREIRRPREGAYEVQAVLHATDGDSSLVSAKFEVQ